VWKRHGLCGEMFDPEVEVEVSDVRRFIEIVLKYIDVLLEIAGVVEFEVEEEVIETIIEELKWINEYDDIYFTAYI